MYLWEIMYNGVLLVSGILFLIYYLKRKNFFALFSGFIFFGILSFAFAFLLAPDNFGILRLLCYAIFIHGIILCDLFFILLYKTKKPLSFLFGLMSFLILIIGVDAFFIEPQSLQISRVEMKSDKLKQSLRIVVFSDLQTDEITDYEKNAIELTLQEKPDIILLTGDYIQTADPGKRNELYGELNQLLRDMNFSAPQGIYAVNGDVDADDWLKIFEGTEVMCFNSSTDLEKEDFVLSALDLAHSHLGDINIQKQKKFHILFGHAPDFSLSMPDADLLVAGHTHGGQIQLPFFGPLLTLSKVPRTWASGATDIDENSKLIVSRGIGMERENAPRLRFLCKPEIVVVTVIPG